MAKIQKKKTAKMGRPRKSDQDRRRDGPAIKLYVSHAEREQIEAAAELDGETMSGWSIRHLLSAADERLARG